MKLQRVVLRLLRRIEDPDALALMLKMVIVRIRSLSARLQLVEMVGHREGAGRKLVSEDEAQNLEEQVLAAIEHAAPESLAQERNLVRLLFWAREVDRERGGTLSARLAERDPVFLAMLRSSLRESHSATVGDVVSRIEYQLAWDAMCKLFGEDVVKRRVEELARARDGGGVSSDERASLALDVARRYAAGWRPDW